MASTLPKRLFRLVEELQGRERLTASELGLRLGVSERTIRRDLLRLQELDLPVEAWPGRNGGVSLPAGALLPALRFTDDELLALVVGLGQSADTGDPDLGRAARSALKRLDAVLSPSTRTRVQALSDALSVGSAGQELAVPAPSEFVVKLAEASHRRRRVEISYRSNDALTRRQVDPYGLARIGPWYLVGYCHLRQDQRTFRLDRIRELHLTEVAFDRPAGFDAFKAAARSIALAPGHGEMVCHAWLDTDIETASRLVPLTAVALEPADPGVRVTVRTHPEDVARIVFHLLRLPCPVRIEDPPELVAACRAIAVRAAAMT